MQKSHQIYNNWMELCGKWQGRHLMHMLHLGLGESNSVDCMCHTVWYNTVGGHPGREDMLKEKILSGPMLHQFLKYLEKKYRTAVHNDPEEF